MRGGVVAALVSVSLLLAASPAGAGSSRSSAVLHSMTVASSPRAAGAHRVRLSVTLRYQMQCSYPGAGDLTVTFPAAVKLPKRFAAGTIKLAGKPIAATVKARKVTVSIPPPQGVLCGTVGPGSVTLVFTHKAKLSNPAQAGSYAFTAVHQKLTFAAKLAVKK